MKITVIGTGYVGLVAGLGFAEFGNDVVCLDVDTSKIEELKRCKSPIYEPGVEELLEKNIKASRITFTTNTAEAIRHGKIIFIGVGTPQTETGEADLTYVYSAATDIGKHINEYKVIVDKSTVPVGTGCEVYKLIKSEIEARGADISFDVASNPEFLREGRAVGDFMNPDRIVLGVGSQTAKALLQKLYSVFNRSNKPIIVTNIETAEMIKYATNAFLATKITFINEIANLCEQVGANVNEVAIAMGKDGRISPKFLHAGPGYGGSCFPKDTAAIATIGRKHGAPLSVIESVIKANRAQKELAAKKIANRFPNGAIIAILGIAFKPDTDDIRESPTLDIVNFLAEKQGFIFRMFDPQAMQNGKRELKEFADKISWCNDIYEACEGADCVAVVTEWLQFRTIDFDTLKTKLNNNVVFDFRNIYNHTELRAASFEVYGTGV